MSQTSPPLHLVLGLVGHWELIDIDRPLDAGPVRDELEATGVNTQLRLQDPSLELAAALVQEVEDQAGVAPLIAWVLVSRHESDPPSTDVLTGEVVPRRVAQTLDVVWPGVDDTVKFREVSYTVPTDRGYEFAVRFMSPNTNRIDEVDFLFDSIMASSFLAEA